MSAMHRCVWFCFGAYTSVALGASPPPCGGGRVYFKVEAALTVGDQRITADQLQQPAIIEKVEGDRAWLAGGWLPISELIAMGEAEGYYNAEIKRDPSDATARYLRGL
ncbi:MAG TPA: hypothetical protein VGE52_11010, partial [Pirellulales bacterium]